MIVTLLASAPLLLGGTVLVRSEAQVLGPTLELSEIAEIRADSVEAVERLSSVCLGSTPAPGSTRKVTRDEIARAVRALGLECTLGGAVACRAEPRIEVVSGRDLEAAARTSLSALFAGRDAEISLARPAADLPLIAPERKRDLTADLSRAEPVSGPWNVPVDVRVDGSRVQTVWVALEVRRFERVPVAVRDLHRGDTFEPDSWKLERVCVDASAPRAPEARLLAGAVCTRDLARGARIIEADVQRELLVKAGQEVELEVIRGIIRARTLAVARGQGALGDRVEVQSGENQRRLTGVVVGRGLIRVELSQSPRNPR